MKPMRLLWAALAVCGFSQRWGDFAAVALIVALPIVVLFLFLQRYLVSGLTAGSVKG
jgi:arabinogalactan oligomer / maltooligosaccharide transport system permease protein